MTCPRGHQLVGGGARIETGSGSRVWALHRHIPGWQPALQTCISLYCSFAISHGECALSSFLPVKTDLPFKAKIKFYSPRQSLPWLHWSQSSLLWIHKVLLIGRIHCKLSACICTFFPNPGIPSFKIGPNLLFSS